jgi:hypothetical protein
MTDHRDNALAALTDEALTEAHEQADRAVMRELTAGIRKALAQPGSGVTPRFAALGAWRDEIEAEMEARGLA